MTVWFAAPGAFWTFAESAAAARNVPAGTISIALAVGNGVGLLGSVAAAWQGDRWGRFWPLLIATAALCASVVAFEECWSVVALAVALFAFNAAWNYAAVYEMALVASLDPGGKLSPAISAAQVMGFAAGGFISGVAISAAGYTALTSVVTMLAVVGMGVLALCFRVPRRAVPGGP
jgi:predicted MFS family arabinose efflux permease